MFFLASDAQGHAQAGKRVASQMGEALRDAAMFVGQGVPVICRTRRAPPLFAALQRVLKDVEGAGEVAAYLGEHAALMIDGDPHPFVGQLMHEVEVGGALFEARLDLAVGQAPVGAGEHVDELVAAQDRPLILSPQPILVEARSTRLGPSKVLIEDPNALFPVLVMVMDDRHFHADSAEQGILGFALPDGAPQLVDQGGSQLDRSFVLPRAVAAIDFLQDGRDVGRAVGADGHDFAQADVERLGDAFGRLGGDLFAA